MSHPTLPSLVRVSPAVFVVLVAAQTARASLLTIGDPSFEGVSLGAGGFTSGGYAANSWNSNSNAGILRPTASQYPGGAPAGVNVAYSNSGAVIDQVLSATLTANTTYTLSVDVGSRLDGPFNDGYSIELLAGGNLLSETTNVPAPTNGSFTLATDVYTAGASDPHLGQALEIQLVSAATGQTSFDNVTLDASSVPEPSSWMLLGLTAMGAGLRRGRGKSQ